MDDTFKIQLKIAENNYPLECKRSDEKIFRSAANLINYKFNGYGNKYPREASTQKIAMTACDIASSYIRLLDQQNETPAYDKIEILNEELEDFINSES